MIFKDYIRNGVCTEFDIDSECFRGVRYTIKDGQLIIQTRKNGVLSCDLKVVSKLAKEITDIATLYKGFDYKRYVLEAKE